MNGLLDEQTAHFVSEHRRDDVRTLALSASRYPGVDMPRALEQIAGWQMLERKVPSWAAVEGLLLPPKLPLEQCSSQATATYKARLVGSGKSLADLTGGLGIDCTFMGQAFEQVTYVERQEWLCRLARHNFPLLGLRQAEVTCGDAAEMLDSLPPVDCIFLDPARLANPADPAEPPEVEAYLERMTATAASVIGAEDALGTLEKGKYADAAVYDQNQLSMSIREFADAAPYMIIVNGKIVLSSMMEVIK